MPASSAAASSSSRQKRPLSPSAISSRKSSGPPQKQRKRYESSGEDRLAKTAQSARDRLLALSQKIKNQAVQDQIDVWIAALMDVSTDPDKPSLWEHDIQEPLPSEYDERDKKSVKNALRIMNTFLRVWRQIEQPSLPEPSLYALEWKDAQEQPNKLLCCRPIHACGLPLCTMHTVFGRFFTDIREKNTTPEAHMVARSLCMGMPRYFDSEYARSRMWEGLTEPFLGDFRREDTFHAESESSSCQPDSTFYAGGVPIAIREVKSEVGKGGDVWFQLSRVYDIVAKTLNENKSFYVGHGAPMFLIGISGQLLLIFGAFFDGRHTLVELLVDPLVMGVTNYANTDREDRLAVALQALKNGIDSLALLATSKRGATASFPALTPRVYVPESWKFDPPSHGTLEFKESLKPRDAFMSLLFAAELSSNPDIPVFVKLVPDHYGEDVHKLLAQSNLAPTLFGSSKSESTYKAYAMEYLDPLSWCTLHDLLSRDKENNSRYESWVRHALRDVLECLSKGDMVHGDLRECNIMVQVDALGKPQVRENKSQKQQLVIKVIDFDWGGKARVAVYPIVLNPEIPWPGTSGELIQQIDDQVMVETWYKKWFKNEFSM